MAAKATPPAVTVTLPGNMLPARLREDGGEATSARLRAVAARVEERQYEALLGDSLGAVRVPGVAGCALAAAATPRASQLAPGGTPSEPSALRSITSQASLAFNMLASVLGAGFVGYWLSGGLVQEEAVRARALTPRCALPRAAQRTPRRAVWRSASAQGRRC